MYHTKIEVYGLDHESETYDWQKHGQLHWIVRQLSREKMSVKIVAHLLLKIFTISDLKHVRDPEDLFQILFERFKLCSDLAKSCKLSVQDLLRFCSRKVYSSILRMIILCPDALKLVETFIGAEFYKKHMLPQSWFHLIKNNEMDSKIVEDIILHLKVNDGKDYLVNIHELKDQLHHCISKIALLKNKYASEKKSLLKTVMGCFRINSEADMISLFKSKIDKPFAQGQKKQSFFESEVLLNIMDCFGMGRKYFMENLLSNSDEARVLPFYSKKNYLDSKFFQRQNKNDDSSDCQKRILDAFEFISTEFKKDHNSKNTDFPIAFLEAFNQLYSETSAKLDQKSAGQKSLLEIQKQNKLIKFIRSVELIFKNNYCENEYMRNALIN